MPHTRTRRSRVARGAGADPADICGTSRLNNLLTSSHHHTRRSYQGKVTTVPFTAPGWLVRGPLPSGTGSKIAVGNQLDPGLRKRASGLGQRQGAQFRFPGFPQAGFGSLKVGIVVSGMADKFPGAVGNAGCNRTKKILVEDSGYLHAQRPVRRGKTLLFDGRAESAGKALQHTHFGVAPPDTWPGQKVSRAQGTARPEGVTQGLHAAGCSRPQQGAQHAGKQVGVLVRVQMGNRDSRCLKFLNLGGGLSLNLLRVEAAGERPRSEARDAIAETASARIPTH